MGKENVLGGYFWYENWCLTSIRRLFTLFDVLAIISLTHSLTHSLGKAKKKKKKKKKNYIKKNIQGGSHLRVTLKKKKIKILA
jgi:hypothetical protein